MFTAQWEEEEPLPPPTADINRPERWITLMLFALTGFIASLSCKRRRERRPPQA